MLPALRICCVYFRPIKYGRQSSPFGMRVLTHKPLFLNAYNNIQSNPVLQYVTRAMITDDIFSTSRACPTNRMVHSNTRHLMTTPKLPRDHVYAHNWLLVQALKVPAQARLFHRENFDAVLFVFALWPDADAKQPLGDLPVSCYSRKRLVFCGVLICIPYFFPRPGLSQPSVLVSRSSIFSFLLPYLSSPGNAVYVLCFMSTTSSG